MGEQVPTIGRIVHYRLSASDAEQINQRRINSADIAQGLPAGAHVHVGNTVAENDTFPMMITCVWGDSPSSAVNGQVFLDGNDALWVTSVCVGGGSRTFSWPVR